MPPTPPLPADWVDHPQIPITRRAVLAGVGLMLLAVIVALASVYARRTQLEKTREFWGAETILALQSSPQVTLQLDPARESTTAEPASSLLETIELTGTPGLGHLRHALLDQRHYDWGTRTAASVGSLRSRETRFATLTFSDPSDQFPTASIHLELTAGWVGAPEREDRVQLKPRVQPAVHHFLNVVSNAQQSHYDQRQADQRENGAR